MGTLLLSIIAVAIAPRLLPIVAGLVRLSMCLLFIYICLHVLTA